MISPGVPAHRSPSAWAWAHMGQGALDERWVEETLGEPEAGRVGEEGAMILVEESGDSGCRQKENQLLKF